MSGMQDQRIVGIKLDERTVVRRSPEIEHERAVAIYDLLEGNTFIPQGDFTGPYNVFLTVEERTRLVMEIRDPEDSPLGQVKLPLQPFRRIIRDYFQICESYFDAIKRLSPSQIETIDMARRGMHNEGSEILIECLKDKVEIDMDTARRLFTLLCVLHIRG